MRLTYTHSKEFRSGTVMLILVLCAEGPLWAGLAWFLPYPWRWLPLGVLGLGAAILPTALLPLFRAHQLGSEALTLRMNFWQLSIPRDRIGSVRPFDGWVELGFAGRLLAYDPEANSLVVAAARRGLVEVQLKEQVSARVPKVGVCTFDRVLLTLDDPGLLLRAFPAAGGGIAGGGIAEGEAAGAVVTEGAVPAGGGPAGDGLDARGLTRRYGSFTAVQDVNLTVHPGEIVALLGANGAGKSTTLGMLAGLVRPDAGEVILSGWDLHREPLKARAALGYVPDTPVFHETLTAREFLWFVGDLYGLPPATARTRAQELLVQMKLAHRADSWILSYSLGMRRKLSIASALMHRPRVLILDEVTNGLDPRANREVLDLLNGLARQGTAVLLATHVLPVAEELADRIAILDEGRLKAAGTLAKLRTAAALPESASLESVFLALTTGGDHACA